MQPFHLSPQNLPVLIEKLKDFLNQGKYPIIIVRENTRSEEQHRRLFGHLYKALANHTGYSVDEVHELMKFKFLREMKEVGGQKIDVTKSTKKMTIQEMVEYQQKIEQWGAEIGCKFDDNNLNR